VQKIFQKIYNISRAERERERESKDGIQINYQKCDLNFMIRDDCLLLNYMSKCAINLREVDIVSVS
jgi:hypothetical protein